MLVLSRKLGERIVIGDNITVKINRIHGNRVTLGIEAPDDVTIMRGELEPIASSFRKPQRDVERSPTGAPLRAEGTINASGASLDSLI